MTINDPVTQDPLPSAWAAYLPVLNGTLRAVIAALGATGVTWAQAVSGSQVEMWGGILMMLAAALWSGWTHIAAIHEARQLAIANSRALSNTAAVSAKVGEPIVIPPSIAGTAGG